MLNIPPYVIESSRRLSERDIEAIRRGVQRWHEGIRNGFGLPLILDEGLRLVQFQAGPQVPDAFCRFCGVANLSTSVWCHGCGAPMIREAA